MLKEESISRRIHLSFDRHEVLKDASCLIRRYFEEVIRETFKNLEMDNDEINHTSSENLRFAIDVTIYDDFSLVYKEAQEYEKENN